MFRRIDRHFFGSVACVLVLASGVSCTLFRNAGTGSHYDAPQARSDNPKASKKHDMLVEVTTDPNGDVVNIEFKRSSGEDTLDRHVADTIHSSWPKMPSTVTLAEIVFSMSEGFSQPKIISSHPVR